MKSKISPIFLIIACCLSACTSETWTDEQITEYWTSGKTLPSEVLKQYPLPEQPVVDDKGLNVLIDMAHECNFAALWTLPEQLNKLGYRSVGSHATINSVLDPKGESRIRMVYDTVNHVRPFVWWPNAKYNIIISSQSSWKSQTYTDKEVAALKLFVESGGSLFIRRNGREPRTDQQNPVPIDILLSTFDLTPEDGVSRHEFGRGRILLSNHPGEYNYPRRANQEQRDSVNQALGEQLEWLSENQKAQKGTPCLPEPMEGGGGVYPELEDNFSNIVFYYAENQKEELLNAVKVDVPKAQEFILERLPSKPTAEPMYLILCAGGGGGWAVNIYRPKENGIISLDPFGILSIFAHELAHTMHGPVNEAGEIAGISPIPNRGEAHAGWYQGKVNALFKESDRELSNRNCNSMFDWDPEGNQLDLATEYENEAGREKWGYGKDWTKTWYLWQKLDDRYGPTWYPRWKYIQHTRWQNDPEHHLTWTELVEDMSIAVGEDLFPFMRKLGTTLERDRMEEIEFQGETMKLELAPIEVTPGGNVRIEKIGDYRVPLK